MSMITMTITKRIVIQIATELETYFRPLQIRFLEPKPYGFSNYSTV